ncbi:unnamed protein product [Pylaiella littoralis]
MAGVSAIALWPDRPLAVVPGIFAVALALPSLWSHLGTFCEDGSGSDGAAVYILLAVWETALVAFEYAPPLRPLRGTRSVLLLIAAVLAAAPSSFSAARVWKEMKSRAVPQVSGGGGGGGSASIGGGGSNTCGDVSDAGSDCRRGSPRRTPRRWWWWWWWWWSRRLGGFFFPPPYSFSAAQQGCSSSYCCCCGGSTNHSEAWEWDCLERPSPTTATPFVAAMVTVAITLGLALGAPSTSTSVAAASEKCPSMASAMALEESAAAERGDSAAVDPLATVSKVRVVNFNVYMGYDRRGENSSFRVVELLKRLEADVAALQETGLMRLTLGNRHYAWAVARAAGMVLAAAAPVSEDTWGCAILSRLPVLSWGWARLPRGPGENACEAHATLSLGPGRGVATVVNVHLGNEGDTELQVTGLLSLLEDLRKQDLRKNYLRQSSRDEEDRRLLIVVGDFNFDSNSSGYSRLVSEAGLQSASNSSSIADYDVEDGFIANVSHYSAAAAEEVGDGSVAKKVYYFANAAAAAATDVHDDSTTKNAYYPGADYISEDVDDHSTGKVSYSFAAVAAAEDNIDDDSTSKRGYYFPATAAAAAAAAAAAEGMDSRPSLYRHPPSSAKKLEDYSAFHQVAVPMTKYDSSLRGILGGYSAQGGDASGSGAARDGYDGSSDGGDIQGHYGDDGDDDDEDGDDVLYFTFFAAEDGGISLASYEVHREFSQERYSDGYPSVTDFEVSCPSLSAEDLRLL